MRKEWMLELEKKKEDEESLIIEENTIYEVDLSCYECLQRENQRLQKNKNKGRNF